MKKYTLVLAAFVVTMLVACGSGSTATQANDSTAVKSDSAAVTVDTTAPKAAVDSVAK